MTWYVKDSNDELYGPFDAYHEARDKGREISPETGDYVELLEVQESFKLV